MQRQIMKQMQKKFKDSLEKIQEELGSQVVEGTSGGGMVKVQVNGHMEVLSIKIDPSVVNPEEVDMLEDLVLVAVKDAMSKAQVLGAERMGQLAGGLGLPRGLF